MLLQLVVQVPGFELAFLQHFSLRQQLLLQRFIVRHCVRILLLELLYFRLQDFAVLLPEQQLLLEAFQLSHLLAQELVHILHLAGKRGVLCRSLRRNFFLLFRSLLVLLQRYLLGIKLVFQLGGFVGLGERVGLKFG